MFIRSWSYINSTVWELMGVDGRHQATASYCGVPYARYYTYEKPLPIRANFRWVSAYCTDVGEFSMSQRVRMRKIFEPEKSLASKICVRMRKDMVPRFRNGTPASPIPVRRSSCRIRILQPVRRTRTSRIACIIAYRDIYAYRDGIAVCLHREVIACRQHRD